MYTLSVLYTSVLNSILFHFRLIVIFFGLTTICCVLGFDFSLHNARRNLQYGRGSRIDVIGRPHNVETSGWKAMYSTRVPGSSAKGEGIFTTEETKVEMIAPSSNYHKTEGAIPHNTHLDSR